MAMFVHHSLALQVYPPCYSSMGKAWVSHESLRKGQKESDKVHCPDIPIIHYHSKHQLPKLNMHADTPHVQAQWQSWVIPHLTICARTTPPPLPLLMSRNNAFAYRNTESECVWTVYFACRAPCPQCCVNGKICLQNCICTSKCVNGISWLWDHMSN